MQPDTPHLSKPEEKLAAAAIFCHFTSARPVVNEIQERKEAT